MSPASPRIDVTPGHSHDADYAYWVQITKGWLRRRRNEGVEELRVKGPGGAGVSKITEDTDLAELSEALHKVLFPKRESRPADVDDIAL